MGFAMTKFKTTVDLLDIDRKRIPKGSVLILCGNKYGLPLFRNAENGSGILLNWKEVRLSGRFPTMTIVEKESFLKYLPG